MNRLKPSCLIAIATLGLVGCSADLAPSAADANAISTHALITVEQVSVPGVSAQPRARASVWFVRGSDEQSVSAAVALLSNSEQVPVGNRCFSLGAPSILESNTIPVPVELSYAGLVNLQARGSAVGLPLRAFPDVGNVMSGVMYSAPGQSDLSLTAGDQLVVSWSGAEGMPAQNASVEMPEPPANVRIMDVPLGDAVIVANTGPALPISWQPEHSADRMYVDIEPSSGKHGLSRRCVSRDTGATEVVLDQKTQEPEWTITVHRVHESELQTAGGQAGTAHFDLAVAGRVRVELP